MIQGSLRFGMCCALIAGMVAVADAQLPTTVQLPSISSFSYRGSVVVPDSGAAHLGSNRSRSSALRRRGFSHGLGVSSLHSGASVHARIIDLNEMDRQLLGGKTPQEFARSQQRKPAVKTVDPDQEGKALVRHARTLWLDGKKGESFDTYQMAIEVLSPSLRDLATKEFKRLFGHSAVQALRFTSLRR